MTHVIRETDKYTFFEDKLQGVTAIQQNHFPHNQTDWNTGIDAFQEKRFLIPLPAEEFDKYCKTKFD